MAYLHSVIGGFFVRALLWLAPALAVWYLAREWVVAPVGWLAGQAMRLFFSRWAKGVELEGTTVELVTSIQVYSAGGTGVLIPDVEILKYCFGLPLLAAMLLAVGGRRLWLKLLLGACALLPFQAWGVCFEWLMTLAIKLNDSTSAVTGFTALHNNLIALGYQFGYLLLPTLAPLLLWALMERKFIATVMVEGAMTGRLRED